MSKPSSFVFTREFDFSDESVAKLTDDEVGRIPASFLADYGSFGKLYNQLHAMGCSFSRGGQDEDTAYAIGVMRDGTEIRIEAKRGKDYKSPQDYVKEVRKRLEEEMKDKQ